MFMMQACIHCVLAVTLYSSMLLNNNMLKETLYPHFAILFIIKTMVKSYIFQELYRIF